VSEDQLRPLFERVLTAPPPDTTDVDAAISSGSRARRVRRTAAVLCSAAAVAGLLTVGPVLGGGGAVPDRVPPVAGPSAMPAPRVPGPDEGAVVTAAGQLVGTWRAVRVGGRDVWAARDDGEPPTLGFHVRPDGQLTATASDGCNAHSGRVAVSSSGRFRVPTLLSTFVLCDDPPFAAHVDALRRADQARIVPGARGAPEGLLLQRRGTVLGAYQRVEAVPRVDAAPIPGTT